jgi:hypothetical protein
LGIRDWRLGNCTSEPVLHILPRRRTSGLRLPTHRSGHQSLIPLLRQSLALPHAPHDPRAAGLNSAPAGPISFARPRPWRRIAGALRFGESRRSFGTELKPYAEAIDLDGCAVDAGWHVGLQVVRMLRAVVGLQPADKRVHGPLRTGVRVVRRLPDLRGLPDVFGLPDVSLARVRSGSPLPRPIFGRCPESRWG